MTHAGADITIGHCHINVRRSRKTASPWLDTAHHKATADRVRLLVLTMLEDLLARHIPTDIRDLPALSIDLALSAQDLKGAAPLARPAMRARLDATLRQAVQRAVKAVPTSLAQDENPPHNTPPALNRQQTVHNPDPSRLADILDSLFAGGTISVAARTLPIPALIKLIEAILRALSQETPQPETPVAASARGFQTDAKHFDRPRLAALLSQLNAAVQDTSAPDTTDETLPAVTPSHIDQLRQQALQQLAYAQHANLTFTTTPPADRAQPVTPDQPIHAQTTTSAQLARDKPALQLPSGRLDFDHLLPLLALSTLARHGIVDALAIDLAELTPLALAGVAMKVLTPMSAPRQASETAAIAISLGRASAPQGDDFVKVAAALTAPVTRAMMAQSLIGTLGPGVTVPLVSDPPHLVLFDPAGLSPVLQGRTADIAPLLGQVERPLFLQPSETDTLSSLATAGLPTVASGPPPRSSKAAAISGPDGWRGHTVGPANLPVALSRRLPAEGDIAENAAEVWHDLTTHNRLVAPAAATAQTDQFDNLVSLLAGFALADIGWALSRHDPKHWADPYPKLVRDRFSNLSGHLTIADDHISVTLPMGRRFTDLRDAGVLRDITAPTAWFGRRITYQGG